jgi:hypothetical protein
MTSSQQRKMHVVAVKVNNVEARRIAKDEFHEPHVVRQCLAAIRVAP